MFHRDKGIPVCVHGHKIPLPLLADFPKKRVDVNPFHSKQFFEDKWGCYRLSDISKLTSSDLPILLFLDAFTVNNVKIQDLDSFNGEVHLFVGDTQHGTVEGLLALIQISQKRCVKRVYFVNNHPQHAHWFAQEIVDFEKFFFLPIGLANYEQCDSWESRYLTKSVVHVGNILQNHKYRGYICAGLIKYSPVPIALLRTDRYQAANAIHKTALASLNISLNSDLSFRLSEIIVSGGLCVSDEIGFVQRSNYPYFNSMNLVTFKSISDLISILKDINTSRTITNRPVVPDVFDGKRLRSLDDVDCFANRVVDPRLHHWQRIGGSRLDTLSFYCSVRDACISDVHPVVELNIDSASDLDMFLDVIDLPRLTIVARCSGRFLSIIQKYVSRFDLGHRVNIVNKTVS